MAETENKDPRGPFYPVGTKVAYDGTESPEYGIVIACWFDEEIKAHDCYVAFYGDTFPEGRPDEKPYVLRYSSLSLRRVYN